MHDAFKKSYLGSYQTYIENQFLLTLSVSDLKSVRMNGKSHEAKILKDKEASLAQNICKGRKCFCK